MSVKSTPAPAPQRKPTPTPAPARARQWWRIQSRWERFTWVALVVLAVGQVALQLVFVNWWIEDSAISFTYARHLAQGEGLVTYPGGERVEGYSNPLWTFLMAAWQLVGVDGFVSSKVMGAGFGAATVLLSVRITRRIHQEDDVVPLLAGLVLALNPQFVIWNASGLENALFCFLIALGVDQAMAEAEEERWPWSALAFFGLAITRPEGIVYAAVAGFCYLVTALGLGRGVLPVAKWLVTFFVPFGAYHAVRYSYFGWTFPNTFYAKSNRREFNAWDWDFKGWRYVRDWAEELWQGGLVPVYVVAMTGLRGRRAVLAMVTLLALGVVLLLHGPGGLSKLPLWPRVQLPSWWEAFRVGVLLVTALVVPMIAIGRRGWPGRILLWGLLGVAVWFAVRAGGDWMRGFRWLNHAAVPLSILFALGLYDVAELLSRVGRRLGLTIPYATAWLAGVGHRLSPSWGGLGFLAASALLVTTTWPSIEYLQFYSTRTETSPQKVRRRVNYMQYAQHRMHLDQVTLLDVDMGAHMWWSGWDIVDIAGLVDVPFAHHDYERPFVKEYVFQERKPDFAHVHGGWAKKLRASSHKEFELDYFEIPPYPTGKTSLHQGNHVRRDHFLAAAWESDDRRVTYPEGLVLVGWRAPIGEVAPGRSLYLEIGLQRPPTEPNETLRLIVTLSGKGGQHSWSLGPGYDWLTPEHWREHEIVLGRYGVTVPATLPPGSYDLAITLIDIDGAVAQPESVPEGAVLGTEDAAYARGEVRWTGAVQVVTEVADDARVAERRRALAADAASGLCESAESGWQRLRHHRPNAHPWLASVRPGVAREIALCWLGRADRESERAQQVALLARAHDWDHRAPGLTSFVRPIAASLYDDGMAAHAEQDWEAAYQLLTDSLRIYPWNPAARRWAEDARDHRLDIHPEQKAEAAAARKRRRDLHKAEVPPAAQIDVNKSPQALEGDE